MKYMHAGNLGQDIEQLDYTIVKTPSDEIRYVAIVIETIRSNKHPRRVKNPKAFIY